MTNFKITLVYDEKLKENRTFFFEVLTWTEYKASDDLQGCKHDSFHPMRNMEF